MWTRVFGSGHDPGAINEHSSCGRLEELSGRTHGVSVVSVQGNKVVSAEGGCAISFTRCV
jgi:hypothetical protein